MLSQLPVSTTIFAVRHWFPPAPLDNCQKMAPLSAVDPHITSRIVDLQRQLQTLEQMGHNDRTELTEVVTAGVQPSNRAPYLFERDGNLRVVPIITNLEGNGSDNPMYHFIIDPPVLDEKWQPRIRMMEAAHDCKNIFAISVVPKNPESKQTLYYKNSYCKNSAEGTLISNSHAPCKETALSGAKKLIGFIKPFPSFASKNYVAELDPYDIAATGLDKFDHKIAFYPPSLQDSLRKVLMAFREDKESTLIGLTLLHKGRVERLFFSSPL